MLNVETPISEYAIIVSTDDNVAVVKKETFAGLEVQLPNGSLVKVRGVAPPGHRFATRDIPGGEFVTQFGQPIGTSLGIESGDQITHDNMSDDVPIVRELPQDLHTAPPDYLPINKRGTFRGYRRPDGRVGTRNYVLIVPTSMCASHEASQISPLVASSMVPRRSMKLANACSITWSRSRAACKPKPKSTNTANSNSGPNKPSPSNSHKEHKAEGNSLERCAFCGFLWQINN